jgi:hypothetical protein
MRKRIGMSPVCNKIPDFFSLLAKKAALKRLRATCHEVAVVNVVMACILLLQSS